MKNSIGLCQTGNFQAQLTQKTLWDCCQRIRLIISGFGLNPPPQMFCLVVDIYAQAMKYCVRYIYVTVTVAGRRGQRIPIEGVSA